MLWTDIIDPATLTGYARADLEDYEAAKGTLAVFLPNRPVDDIEVSFRAGSAGLVPEAQFRAYDAEIKKAPRQGGRRIKLELPALGQNVPVDEYTQLRSRNASDERIRDAILATTRQVVRAVADRQERLRGIVLVTGRATIPELVPAGDDFGRDPSHTVTVPTPWTDPAADRQQDIQNAVDVYKLDNGVPPGAMAMNTTAFRDLANGNQFQTQLINGGARRPTDAEVRAFVEGAGLPPIVINDRRTASGPVLPNDTIVLLPAPVDADDWEGTELGATFWGQTLSAIDPDWEIEESEQPGIVAGVFREPKPPMIAEVISDAIGMPVLANANLSLALKIR
ncbi:major capsid protein [Cellulomonas sp. P4]|uniref:major capsid protein n=1 Tax=Cellulomonas sp. P4 TaxID=3142533 RepID=UPI0031BBC0A5